MPSKIHDSVAFGFNTDITDWLKDVREGRAKYNGGVCSDDNAIAIAQKIKAKGTGRIKFPAPDARYSDHKEPDLAFRHVCPVCKFPGLVVEVAWSQRKLELPPLAKNYIQKTNGDIRTVIGLNLNDVYKEGENRSATFSVWRAELDVTGRATGRVSPNVDHQVCFLRAPRSVLMVE